MVLVLTKINMPKVIDFKLLMKEFGGDSVWEYIEHECRKNYHCGTYFGFVPYFGLTILIGLELPEILSCCQKSSLNHIMAQNQNISHYLQSSSIPSWFHEMLTDFSACMLCKRSYYTKAYKNTSMKEYNIEISLILMWNSYKE